MQGKDLNFNKHCVIGALGKPLCSNPEAPVGKDDFKGGYNQKDETDHGIESKEGIIDPLETAFAGQPMFHHQCDEDQGQACDVGEPKGLKKTENCKDSPHDHMAQKRSLKRVFNTPAHHYRMKSVFAVEFVVLHCVDNIKANQPENDGDAQQDWGKTH